MANYYGTGISNSFVVKDVKALEEALSDTSYELYDESTEEVPNLVSIYVDDPDGTGFWETELYDEESDDYTSFSVPDMIAEHLAEGQVAVFFHVGNEKARYVIGYTVAVHSSGKQSHLSLDAIYDKAAEEFQVPVESIRSA